jgi:hypothetical protein
MVEPLRHRQTKGAETDMFDLQLPRHISTLPEAELTRHPRFGRDWVKSGHNSDVAEVKRLTQLRHRCSTALLPDREVLSFWFIARGRFQWGTA